MNITCLLVNSEDMVTWPLLKVRTTVIDLICDLTWKIGQLLFIPSKYLRVWRPKDSTLLKDSPSAEWSTVVETAFSNKQLKALSGYIHLSKLGLREDEILVVTVPQSYDYAPALRQKVDKHGARLFKKYEKTFIQIRRPGPLTMKDIELHAIEMWSDERSPVPTYVEKFHNALLQKREPDIKKELQPELTSEKGLYQFGHDNQSTGADKSIRKSAAIFEAMHMWNELKRGVRFSEDDLEAAANSKFFYPLLDYMAVIDPEEATIKCRFGTNAWPWKLVSQVTVKNMMKDTMQYQPSINASWWKHGFPCLLVASYSKDEEVQALKHMFLQAGSYVRLANLLLGEEGKPKEFVLPLIYLDVLKVSGNGVM